MRDITDVKVNDREGFVKFLGLLIEDYQKNGEDWVNPDLDSFLEGLEAYAATSALQENNTGITWQDLANILRGARDYE